jgi:hypothetical protein
MPTDTRATQYLAVMDVQQADVRSTPDAADHEGQGGADDDRPGRSSE